MFTYKYKLSEHIFLYNSFDNQSYLVNLETNESFKLNQTSLIICSLLDADWVSVLEIVEELYKQYNYVVEKNILNEDVELFIRDMMKRAFVISNNSDK